MDNKNVAILVFACDRYELLYKGFEYFFNKNWDNSFQIKKYFATENKSVSLDGFENLKSGNGQWTNRLKIILDQIQEEYVIFIQEDMWFNKKVPDGILEKIVDYSQKNKLQLVKLHSAEVYKTIPISINISGYELAEVNKKDSRFLMSHQVSLWEKGFLYSQLKNNEHPWRNERKGSKRLKSAKEKIYQIDLISENGKEQNNSNSQEAISGEYLTISVNACIHPKAKVFMDELEQINSSYARKLIHNMENQLTHDGKPMPRKEDIFKKIKNKVLAFRKKKN